MSLGELEKDLYSRQKRGRVVSGRDKKTVKPEEEKWSRWEKQNKEENEENEMKKKRAIDWRWWLKAGVGLALVTALLAGSFYFLKSWFSQGVEVEVKIKEEEVKIGSPFMVEVSIENVSGNGLSQVKIELSLPEGVELARGASGQRVVTREVGEIPDGVVTKEEFELLALGNPETVQTIEAAVIYRRGTLGSEFEELAKLEVVFQEATVAVDVETPKKVFSGERFQTVIKLKNTAQEEVENLRIILEYPELFTVTDMDREAEEEEEGLSWLIERLTPDGEEEITVMGMAAGPADSFFELKTKLETEVYGRRHVVDEKAASLRIEASPLSLSIHLNNDRDYIARPGDVLNYVLVYENNTTASLRGVVVEAEMTGEMFDLATVKSDGFFNSAQRRLSWNESTQRGLGLVAPGESGTVSFSVRVREQYPISRLSDKNYTLKVVGVVESPTVPEEVAADKTVGVAELLTKISGKAEVSAQALFYDAASGFVNQGAWPPKAETPTQFTIHWSVVNYATDVEEAEVRAYLGPGVRFTGNVKSTVAARPQYDERTGEVVWRIGRIAATKGVVTEPVTAVFQVEAVPPLTAVGSFITLLQATTFRARDEFTGLTIDGRLRELTSQLPDDLRVGEGDGRVTR